VAREIKSGNVPIVEYQVSYGWDIDVKKWFIEIQMPELGEGSILKWYNYKEDYNKELNKFL
jgi:hypothetical protein